MDGRFRRAAGASVVALAVLALAPAAQAAGVGVTSISSLGAGATAGKLTGVVTNESGKAAKAVVSLRVMRYSTGGALIGRTSVNVAAHSTKTFLVDVKVPPSLKKGTYYIAACTPQGGADKGKLGCATGATDLKIKGGDPLQGKLATKAFDVQNGTAASGKARASQAPACTPGARTLSEPGNRVWPELGNGGYKSLHTDIFTVYDAPTNKFLPGNHVELTQQATQCLSEFSLDFDRKNNISSTATTPGPDMTISSITIDGVPATFAHKQPTYAGDPNGLDDPNPLAHQASNTNPVSATNPNPPACAPINNNASSQGLPCGDTKLVITPAQPIPNGATFKVVINYTGQPGIRSNPSLGNEGWFKNNTPVGEGAMVTDEPSGNMAWMPLNNQASVKPTYDIHTTTNYDPAIAPEANRVAIANGRLVSKVVNPPDANFPTGGSRTFNWHSAEPIASYLVENSIGHFDESERVATAGDVLYYEYQGSNIAAARKVTNKAIMDTQEDITHFQELQVNGPFQFNANGIIVASPSASFEEEMQTKIVFVGGSISSQTFAHENMHQWWGDAVSYAQPKYTFFKEGYADMSEWLHIANIAALPAGAPGSAAYNAAFEASITARWAATNKYNTTSTTFWGVAPDNPTSGNLFSTANTYTRPGMSYIALRAILGPDNFKKASTEIQTTYRYGSVVPSDEIKIFHKWMPNQSLGCSNKLDAFFKQWWDTTYTGSPAAGNKPQITGPGLAGGGFYDANGGCSDYGVDVPAPAGGNVPATLGLTLGAPATFTPFTPGLAKTYTATTSANVISSAGDAALSVADASSTAPGHLVNGTFSLPSALKATAISAAGTAGAGGAVSGSPLTLLTYSGPTANDTVTVNLAQDIGATDALRTGAYSKTLTFTLSTTTP